MTLQEASGYSKSLSNQKQMGPYNSTDTGIIIIIHYYKDF